MTARPVLHLPLALLALGAVLRPASAQEVARTAGACDGRIISAITVTANPPSVAAVPTWLRRPVRYVGLLQTTTRATVIRRVLVVDEGRPCAERERAESERLLRLQPFLADATVRAVDDNAGGVRVEVETVDEISTVVGGSLRHGQPSAIRLGNSNVAGSALYVAVRGERGFAYRDGFSLHAIDHQTFGKPYTTTLVAERRPLGHTLTLATGHAFLTDLQRNAWHVGYGDVHSYVSFVRPRSAALSLGVERSFWDAGGVTRIGRRGRRAFFGGLLTHERAAQPGRPVVITDSGLVADPDPSLQGRFAAYENLRVNAVLGARFVRFTTVRGFDALTAAQDIATGVQFGVLGGRSVPQFRAGDDDIFLAADVYAGVGSPRSLLALRAEAEGRQDRATGEWDAMVGSGRLAWYVKMSPSHLFIASSEFSGGWRARLPFQLTLGDRQGGVRGYRASRIGGGQRSVIRLEERWSIGRMMRRADVGLAGFIDAGRTWAGDVPFGVTSPVKAGVGVGVLAAVPRSRRLWRVDLAMPVSADADAKKWEVRFSTTRARGFWVEPRDVARVRAGAAPSAIFTWP